MQSDAPFASSDEIEIQLGSAVLVENKTHRASIVHYRSPRCHGMSQSVIAAEFHVPVHAYCNAFVPCNALTEMNKCEVDLEAHVDSRTLFDIVVDNGCTAEPKLLLMCACERTVTGMGI